MTPPFGAAVANHRGWVRGGGVFLVASTLLLLSGCAMKGDVQRLQDEVAAQSAEQDARLRALAAQIQAEIRALQDTLQVQSGMVVDARGGNARGAPDLSAATSSTHIWSAAIGCGSSTTCRVAV